MAVYIVEFGINGLCIVGHTYDKTCGTAREHDAIFFVNPVYTIYSYAEEIGAKLMEMIFHKYKKQNAIKCIKMKNDSKMYMESYDVIKNDIENVRSMVKSVANAYSEHKFIQAMICELDDALDYGCQTQIDTLIDSRTDIFIRDVLKNLQTKYH